MLINPKKLNPLGFHLLKWTQDPTVRQIFMYGGSSSGKSYSTAQIILLATLHDGENSLVMRKVGAHIKDSIYEDFKVACKQLALSRWFEFKEGVKVIVCTVNGAKIKFKGCDDSEKIKGLSNIKRIYLDELSEFEPEDYNQVTIRLRGKSGQQIIASWNPIREDHWIKRDVFDTETWQDISPEVVLDGVEVPEHLCKVKSIRMNSAKTIMDRRTGEMTEHAPDTVVIQTTYLNNFWVVGSPDGTYGFYDDQCIARFEHYRQHDPNYYNVYALGEWGVLRTGSEFFGSFNQGNHTGTVAYDPSLPIHISVDNNVLPYISITYWQISTDGGTRICQIAETTATTPDNTVRRAARLVADRLKEFAPNAIFLHGDASTKAASTFDDEKRSWMDLFIDTLAREGVAVTDGVGNKNPSVPMSGEFINAIFERQFADLSITIGDTCKASIEDYQAVQKDMNGAILKARVKNKATGQVYEQHGHLSDTFRYLVADVLKEQFTAFSNRRKRNLYARDGAVSFYNPDTECAYSAEMVYAMPNVAGKFVLVHAKKCGERWHILSAIFRETSSTTEIRDAIAALGAPCNVVECSDAYFPFIKELRKSVPNVKVVPEGGEIDRRIAATSDFIKNFVLFNEAAVAEDAEYGAFISNMLDYRKDGQAKEASAVLSGFAKYAARSF